MTLVEFLLARIAEDETTARTGLWNKDHRFASINSGGGVRVVGLSVMAVLDECEAKRRIVELLGGYRENDVEYWALHDALQALTLPYADHPDYDETWRP